MWNQVQRMPYGACSAAAALMHRRLSMSTTSLTKATLLDEYERLVSSGVLKPDPTQGVAVRALALLQKYAHDRSDAPQRSLPSVSGVYLHGTVGSGKTLCLDLFYKSLAIEDAGPFSFSADRRREGAFKRRLHFHEFMLNVHRRLHELQQGRPKVLGRSRLGLPVYRCAQLFSLHHNLTLWHIPSLSFQV